MLRLIFIDGMKGFMGANRQRALAEISGPAPTNDDRVKFAIRSHLAKEFDSQCEVTLARARLPTQEQAINAAHGG